MRTATNQTKAAGQFIEAGLERALDHTKYFPIAAKTHLAFGWVHVDIDQARVGIEV